MLDPSLRLREWACGGRRRSEGRRVHLSGRRTVQSSSTSRSRSMPSPPGCRPAPPLLRRSRWRRTRSGNVRSSASIGVFFVLVNGVDTAVVGFSCRA